MNIVIFRKVLFHLQKKIFSELYKCIGDRVQQSHQISEPRLTPAGQKMHGYKRRRMV